MESFLDLCRRRCSVRDFSDKPVSDSDFAYLLDCLRQAPSAVNFQPWRLLRVTDEEGLSALCRCYVNPWFRTVRDCLVVCCDHSRSWHRKSDGKDHGDIDVAIAVEHLCLAAAERGLGTCWVCNFDADLCRRSFSLPEGVEPVALIPIGYPVEGYVRRDSPRLPVEELWLRRD